MSQNDLPYQRDPWYQLLLEFLALPLVLVYAFVAIVILWAASAFVDRRQDR